MLTPEGRRMLARLSRFRFVPSARGFYMIVASLVLLMLWAWSVGPVFMAVVAVLGGALVSVFILGMVLRKFEGMETAREQAQSAQAQIELENGIERVSGFGNDYTTKL
jgi:hypothetical protein